MLELVDRLHNIPLEEANNIANIPNMVEEKTVAEDGKSMVPGAKMVELLQLVVLLLVASN